MILIIIIIMDHNIYKYVIGFHSDKSPVIDLNRYDLDQFDLNMFYLNQLIQYACKHGFSNVLKRLIELGKQKQIKLNKYKKYFKIACENGHQNIAEIIIVKSNEDNCPIDIKCNIVSNWINICKNGHQNIIEYFYRLNTELNLDLNLDLGDGFYHACINGQYDLAKYLYNLAEFIDINDSNNKIFKKVCENGHLEIAIWLYNLYATDNSKHIQICDKEIFGRVCRLGYFKLAIWFYNISQIDNNTEIIIQNIYFEDACRNGHFHLAKWLYEISLINNDSNNQINPDHYFDLILKTSDLNFIEWVFNKMSLQQIINFKLDPDCFIIACEKNNKDTAQWIFNLNKSVIKQKYFQEAFRKVCYKGNIDMIKWIYNLALENNIKIDFYHFHDNRRDQKDELRVRKWEFESEIFENACSLDSPVIMEWIFHITKIRITSHAFFNACQSKSVNNFKWLYNNSTEEEKELILKSNNFSKYFSYACMNDNMEVPKYIYNLCIENNFIINEEDCDVAFISECCVRNCESALWLCSIFSKYAIDFNDTDFPISVINGKRRGAFDV